MVAYDAPPRIAGAIAAHEAYLRNELLASRLEPGALHDGAVKLTLGGEEIRVSVTKKADADLMKLVDL